LKQKSVTKKTFLIIIVFLFMLSFAGCEGQNSKNYEETSSKNIKQPPIVDQNLLNDKCVKKVLELEKIKR